MTLNQVVQRIKTIALAHKQINDFREGDVISFLRSGDIVYPACLLQILPGRISKAEKQTTVRFALYLCDKVDLSIDSKANELEVKSDLLSIAEDMMAAFDYPTYKLDWDFAEEASIDFLDEDLEDMLSAVLMTLDIKKRFDSNRCQIPTTLTLT